jgi:hypothetical protein
MPDDSSTTDFQAQAAKIVAGWTDEQVLNYTFTGQEPVVGNPVTDEGKFTALNNFLSSTGQIAGQVFQWILNKVIVFLHSSFGGIALIAGAIALILYKILSAGPSSTLPGPIKIRPVDAPIALTQLETSIAKKGSALTQLGVSPTVAQTRTNMAMITMATPLAMGIADTSTPLQPSIVTSAQTPVSYATLNQLDARAYLATLVKNQTPETIQANGAVIHGAKSSSMSPSDTDPASNVSMNAVSYQAYLSTLSSAK